MLLEFGAKKIAQQLTKGIKPWSAKGRRSRIERENNDGLLFKERDGMA